MHKIISAALLAMAVSVPAFAMDNDQDTHMEGAKMEMRAMQDRHMQERRAMEDECQGKMKAMRERHQKEDDDLKVKHGMDRKGKGGMEGRGGKEGGGGGY